MVGPPNLGPSPGPPIGPPSLRFKGRVVPGKGEPYLLTGVTRDSTGLVLGNCTVDLFYAGGDKQRYSSTVSDAQGAYTFMSGDNVSTFFAVFYKQGSPDVAGTTKNNLVFT